MGDAEYMREYRKNKPESLQRQQRTARVRNRALAELARLFPETYHVLLEREYDKDRSDT